MSVPSEVVEYLDAVFPQAKRDERFTLTRGNAPQVAHLLRLLDALPTGIITLKGQAFAEFGESVESLRIAVDAWRTGNDSPVVERVPQRGPSNPLTLLRKHLAGLADSVISPATADLAFISDIDLRNGLRLDISAANRSFSVDDWKGCTVLSGSVVEALLLWAVDDNEAKRPGDAAAAVAALVTSGDFKKTPKPDRNEWDLFHLIEVSHHLKLISDSTAEQCRIAKAFRNLIHPGRAIRLAQTCSRGTAHSALAAVEHVVDDLS